MSVGELLRSVGRITIDSVHLLVTIVVAPHTARLYSDTFGVPRVRADPTLLTRVEAASARLERGEYAQAISDALEVIDSIKTLIDELEAGEDFDGVEAVRRMLLPVVLWRLRQDDDLDDDSLDVRVLRLGLTLALFLDDKTQEWFLPASTQARWGQLLFGIWDRLDYGAPGGVSFGITDGLALGSMVTWNALFRKRVAQRLPLQGEVLSFFYGFEEPEGGGAREASSDTSIRALRRSATLALADLTKAKPLTQDDYKTIPPEPPTRPPALATLTLVPFASEDGSVLWIRVAGAPLVEGTLGGKWKYRIAVGGGGSFAIPFGAAPPLSFAGNPEAQAKVEIYRDDEPSAPVDPKTEKAALHVARTRLGLMMDGREIKLWLRLERARLSFGRLPLLRFLVPEGFGVNQDVGIVWSSRDGWRFEGGSAGELLLPVDKLLFGVLRVREVRVKPETTEIAGVKTRRFTVTATVGIELKWGRIYLEGIGLAFVHQSGGDAPRQMGGLFDLQQEFVWPPSGYALEVDLRITARGELHLLKGGGYLRRAPNETRTVGAAAFSLLGKFSLTALVIYEDRTGLSQTDGTGPPQPVPPEHDTWLVIASVAFPGGGPGITILALGFLIATHRRSDPDAFFAGLKTGALDAVLFPEDPIGRAAQYAAVLDRLFPLQSGSEVIGLSVKIGALSGRLTLDIGILYDTGGPLAAAKIYVIGQLAFVAPTQKAPVCKLHADLVFLYDREHGDWIVRAELRDSRLFGGELTGELLFFRGDPDLEVDAEGDDHVTVFSVGGFHPSYQLPGPRIPALKRIRLLVEGGDTFRIDGQLYLAITSSCVQFGASLELRARFAGFGLRARLAVDILFTSPLAFEATFEASVEILLGSRTLAGASLRSVVYGFAHARIVGRATISFLFWSYTTPEFVIPMAAGALAAAEREEDPSERVLAALADPEAWDNGGTSGLVIARADRPGLWLSPVAAPRVRQDVAPLDVPLDRFGTTELPTPVTLRIERVSAGARDLATTVVTSEFSPMLYLNLTREEKLAASGFSNLPAGFEVVRPFETGPEVPGNVDYEQVTLDGRTARKRRGPRALHPALAAAAAALTDRDRGRAPRIDGEPVRVRHERFVVFDRSLTPVASGLDAASAHALAKRGHLRVAVEVK